MDHNWLEGDLMYIERDCTIEHNGKTYDAGGAWYDGNRAVGYVGKPYGGMPDKTRPLNDWHGNQIGMCYLATGWRIRSYLGSTMYQIYARIDGVDYTGRGFGEGMSVNLRRCAKQRDLTSSR